LGGGAGAAEGAAAAAEGAEAAVAATGVLASTAWIWGPVLGILAVLGLILGLFFFVTITAVSYCNAGGVTGAGATLASKASGLAGYGDFCATLQTNTNVATVNAPPLNTTPPGPGLTDAAARAQLAAAGITVNQPQPITSLEGISPSVIGELIAFKNACGASCVVVVTGGTETNAGHAGGPCSHISGNKVDIRASDSVNTYIQNPVNFTRIGNRSDGALQYRSNNSNVIYARESDHWDIGGIGC
jgi:hypothetical protein